MKPGYVERMKAKRTILLVEDEALVALTETHTLVNAGYTVVHASSGEQAIGLLETRAVSPDLVLMDIDLGSGIDGPETARAILELKRLPIVFLSSHTEKEVVEKTEEITSYGYVVKDAGEIVLLTSIKMAFRLFDSETRYRRLFENAMVANRQSERRRSYLEAILSYTPDAIVTLDLEHHVVEWNAGATELFGYTAGEAAGKNLDELVTTAGDPSYTNARLNTARVLENQTIQHVEDVRYTKDGKPVDVMLAGAPILIDGRTVGIVATYKDITRQKSAERAAESLIKEKELLLREVYHRIKNDMSLVSSLLSLQAAHHGNPDVSAALSEASARIETMARVYEQSFVEESFGVLRVRGVIETMLKTYTDGEPTRVVAAHVDDVTVPSRVAVSVGIIVNELVTNAMKYAPVRAERSESSETRPKITVRLDATPSGHVRISVRDNGRGFPEPVLAGERTGFGLTVVRALAEQHDGRIELSNDNGACIDIELLYEPSGS